MATHLTREAAAARDKGVSELSISRHLPLRRTAIYAPSYVYLIRVSGHPAPIATLSQDEKRPRMADSPRIPSVAETGTLPRKQARAA